jgi:hypothetical protein
MKIAISILCMLATAAACLSQDRTKRESMVGTDLFHALTEHGFRVEISHAVNSRWSAEAEATLTHMHQEKGKEEITHQRILQDMEDTEKTQTQGSHTGGISLRYWPEGTYTGPFISIGIKVGDSIKTDASAGIGYMIRIWKGSALSLKYETGVLERIRNRSHEAGNISLCINYIF